VKIIFSWRRHHYVARVSTFLIVVALIAGMVGCIGGEFDLTIASTTGGSVTNPGEGTFTYDAGTVVSLEVEPLEGYSFVGWMGDVDTIADVFHMETTVSIYSDYNLSAIFWKIAPMVAAGWDHTVGLSSNGTVVAVGDNTTGGCDVDNWTQIFQIAAGGSPVIIGAFTVGVKLDGTVVSTAGGGPTGIVQVDAGSQGIVGRKPNGTVVPNVSGWTGIIQVATSSMHTVGLKSGGTVVAVGDNNWYGQLDVSGWTDITQVAAGNGKAFTVGLRSNRTVVATGYTSSHTGCGTWTDIIQVAAGYYHTVGLKSNGTVVAVGRNSSGQCNVGNWTDIIQVAAGYEHTVGLKSDGTVVAVGQNNSGQLNVSGWDLIP